MDGIYLLLNAKMFLSVIDLESSSERIFNYSGKLTEIKNINCSILAIFGFKDEYQSNSGGKLKILKENVKDCNIKLVKNAGYGFIGFEERLSKLVGFREI